MNIHPTKEQVRNLLDTLPPSDGWYQLFQYHLATACPPETNRKTVESVNRAEVNNSDRELEWLRRMTEAYFICNHIAQKSSGDSYGVMCYATLDAWQSRLRGAEKDAYKWQNALLRQLYPDKAHAEAALLHGFHILADLATGTNPSAVKFKQWLTHRIDMAFVPSPNE